MATKMSRPNGAQVLRLTPPVAPAGEIDHHMLEALVDLLARVRSGDVIGFACVVHRRDTFFVDAFGSTRDDPYATRGHLLSLDAELARECERLTDA